MCREGGREGGREGDWEMYRKAKRRRIEAAYLGERG